jgi:integrase
VIAENIDPRYRALLLVAAYTGLRWGEAVGLELGRIDFLRRQVEVVEKLEEVNGSLRFTPYLKTDASRATLSLPSHVVELLAEQIRNYPDPDSTRGAVFTSDKGTLLRRSNFARRE